MSGRWRFSAAVAGFTAYSYLATTVTAAWFLRRAHPIDAVASLVWAASLYAPWLGIAALVWMVLKILGPTSWGLSVLAILTVPVTLLTGIAMTLIDATMRGLRPSTGVVMNLSIDRLPVTLLLYTAIAAMGLAASHWRQSRDSGHELGRLHDELNRLRRTQTEAATSGERLMVAVGRSRMVVDPAEIEWIGSAGNYAVVHWSGREGLLRETLSALETRLSPLGFVRSHRSTLVNLARVQELSPLNDGAWRLTLASGEELVVSRSYREDFIARFRGET